jgi:sugar phosphate isomerase/epimerase
MMDAPDVYEFTSSRAWERERAISLTKKTIEMAARFRVDRIVLHLGSTRMRALTRKLEELALDGAAYSRKFTAVKLDLVRLRAKAGPPALALARDALHQLLPLAEQHRVALAIETRSHYEQVPDEIEMLALLEEFKSTPWIGAWHDFGHVQRKANLGLLDHESLLRSIAPRLLGCHVHDVTWPAKDHRVPFTGGGVDFQKLLPLVPPNIPLVWELSPRQRKRDIIEQRPVWESRFGSL